MHLITTPNSSWEGKSVYILKNSFCSLGKEEGDKPKASKPANISQSFSH